MLIPMMEAKESGVHQKTQFSRSLRRFVKGKKRGRKEVGSG